MSPVLTRRRAIVLALTAVPALGVAVAVAPDTGAQAGPLNVSFQQPGTQSWTVPAEAVCATFEVTGAAGGIGAAFDGDTEGGDLLLSPGGEPGFGSQVTATLQLTPGEVLQINVGGAGAGGDNGRGGGFNGGGDGGPGKGSNGAGGGGASDVRRGGTALGNRILVGGGGGGGGAGGPAQADGGGGPLSEGDDYVPEGVPTANPGGDGGDAGTPAGAPGDDGYLSGVTGGTGGGGGTQSAGGAGGTSITGAHGAAGSPGTGGDGAFACVAAGGGGGGWFGGGGGGAGFEGTGAGGGGGSGYGPAGAQFADGVSDGDGSVIVTYTPGDESCVDVLPDDTVPPPDVQPDVVTARPSFTG
jgi:hypothetical protein